MAACLLHYCSFLNLGTGIRMHQVQHQVQHHMQEQCPVWCHKNAVPCSPVGKGRHYIVAL